jgi:hypothetical protein
LKSTKDTISAGPEFSFRSKLSILSVDFFVATLRAAPANFELVTNVPFAGIDVKVFDLLTALNGIFYDLRWPDQLSLLEICEHQP